MDPVSQVLAQQTSGSAQGQGFGQFFVAGQQNARQREQLNLANRAETRLEERQKALLPYEQQLLAAQVVSTGQTAEYNKQKLLTMVQQNHALPQLMSLESYFMKSPQGFKDEVGLAALTQLKDKYPQAFVEGAPGDRLLQLVQMPIITDWKMKRLNDANAKLHGAGQNAGLFVQRFDDRGGPVLGELNQPRAGTVPGQASPIGKLVADYNALRNSGDAEGMQFAKAALIKAGQAEGVAMEFSDDGRLTSFTQGAVGGNKLPASTVARAEETANSAASFVQTGADIMRLAQPGNVGIPGNLNRLTKEFLGQYMDVEAGDEFDFAQATTFFRGAAARLLRSDSQINKDERAEIVKNLPSDGLRESDETAKRKAKGAIKRVAESARRQILRAGRALPPELMTPDEIIAEVQAGKLTKQQAEDALHLLRTYE